MKSGIHPTVHKSSNAKCTSCGAAFEIPSTAETIEIEICRKCHPVYTGKKSKEVKGGRIDRFRKRMSKMDK